MLDEDLWIYMDLNIKAYEPCSLISSLNQGCHKGRFWMKITVRTSARVRIYPANGDLPSANALMRPCGHGSSRTHPHVRAYARKKIKNLKFFFFF
jgi:hypothetical protein